MNATEAIADRSIAIELDFRFAARRSKLSALAGSIASPRRCVTSMTSHQSAIRGTERPSTISPILMGRTVAEPEGSSRVLLIVTSE